MYYIHQTNYKNKILLRSPFVFLRPSCIWSQFLLQLSKFKKSRRTIKIDNFIQFLTLFHVYISVITLSWTKELQLWKITPFTHMIPNTFNAFLFYKNDSQIDLLTSYFSWLKLPENSLSVFFGIYRLTSKVETRGDTLVVNSTTKVRFDSVG